MVRVFYSQVFTLRMLFLSANEQYQSTAGNWEHWAHAGKIKHWPHPFFVPHQTPQGKAVAFCMQDFNAILVILYVKWWRSRVTASMLCCLHACISVCPQVTSCCTTIPSSIHIICQPSLFVTMRMCRSQSKVVTWRWHHGTICWRWRRQLGNSFLALQSTQTTVEVGA